MCGFVGVIGGQPLALDLLISASETLHHRGPDSSGVWSQDSISLAHRRLSILDLSVAGHQPMVSASGDSVLAFNGEIYNHHEIWSASGSGAVRRGHSDTETLVESLEIHGPAWVLEKCVGMFAWSWWDARAKVLWLARDRVGEKPLYYGMIGGRLAFASELKALKALPGFVAKIDRRSLALFLRHNYVPGPHTIYEGIFKLPSGTFLKVPLAELPNVPDPEIYWSPRSLVRGNRFDLDDHSAVSELDSLLRKSISGQMLADVPLGAFLSGGIDSSTVVAVMQALSTKPIRTFTIGFDDKNYNEGDHAAAVARHLRTEHTELYVCTEKVRQVIPKLPYIYDEPFSDSSQIPTLLVAELAKQHVGVALSGDGGDELFGGYTRYVMGRRIHDHLGAWPRWLRHASGAALRSIPPAAWDAASWPLRPLLPPHLRHRAVGDKVHKFANLLDWESSGSLYRHFCTHWDGATIVGATEWPTPLTDGKDSEISDFTERMMLMDQITYLPDDILVKVDRAAMASSLETRVPLLDHRIAEFSWKIPLHMKFRDGQGKWILRQVLKRYIPESLFNRPKMGFTIPLADWLRGPLRDWAEALLGHARLTSEGFFNPEPIRQKWQEHVSGKRNWQYLLWDVLMFQAWYDAQEIKPT